MASELSAADFRAYVEGIERIGGIFALASLVPVIFSTRFDARAGRAELKRKADDKGQAEEEEGEPPLPGIGLPCVLLLIAAELLGSWELFVPVPQAKGKSKGAAAATGFQAIVKGLERGKKAAKPGSSGSLDIATSFIVACLEPKEAFEAIRCIVTISACFIVVFSMLFRGMPSLPSQLRGGRKIVTFMGIALCAIVFGWYQKSLFFKVGKAVASENLLPTFPLTFRALALILAALPSGGAQRGGSPAVFAALQVGSLVSTISSSLVQGEVHKAVAPFQQQPLQDAVLAPSLHLWLVPTVLALLWLFAWHLQGNFGGLALASMLSCSTSPVVLAKAWPVLCEFLGMGVVDTKAAVGLLVRATSVSFAATGVSLFIASGTQGILASMVMLQVILRIHGHEALLGALS